MMYIKIKPHDALFFRDGKPFNAGEDTWANTTIMPNPSVLWGAVASVYFSNDHKLCDIESHLKIKGIYFYNEYNQHIYLPAPRDIFLDETGNAFFEKYVQYDDCAASLVMPYYIQANTNKKVEACENYFIDINDLCNGYYYYNDNLNLISYSEIAIADHKIGITRDKAKHNTEEGLLYRIDMHRFYMDWAFLIDIEYADHGSTLDNGFLKLGGEAKTAFYQRIAEPFYIKKFKTDLADIQKKIPDNEYIKIYFTSPVIFRDGWKPAIENLSAAATGKPFPIGGFDMQKKMPKPMHKAVPAGAVYVYRKERIDELQQAIKHTIDYNKGFGLFEILPL